jgi:hypothetical protein
MGQSVERSTFEHRDFVRFQRALRTETDWLHDRVERDQLSQHAPMAGLELEAWLVDADGRAAPRNAEFIARCASPDVVTEIARFNIEINVPPQPVAGAGLGRLAEALQAAWTHCGAAWAWPGGGRHFRMPGHIAARSLPTWACAWWPSASCPASAMPNWAWPTCPSRCATVR